MLTDPEMSSFLSRDAAGTTTLTLNLPGLALSEEHKAQMRAIIALVNDETTPLVDKIKAFYAHATWFNQLSQQQLDQVSVWLANEMDAETRAKFVEFQRICSDVLDRVKELQKSEATEPVQAEFH